jgi:hypothetical protein
MSVRKTPSPRAVERLAQECQDLRAWLSGPGSSAEPGAFKVALRAYLALCHAVMLMPRGATALVRAGAVDRPNQCEKVIPFEHFDSLGDRVALLQQPALTDRGWVVPDQPAQLISHVDKLRRAAEEMGGDPSSKAALRTMIRRLAERDGESALRAEVRQLGALEKRLSTARSSITKRPKKVPPVRR